MKRQIKYVKVSEDNVFMQAAKEFALDFATDRQMPVGAVLVCREKVIQAAANTGIRNKIINEFHVKKVCVRRLLRVPSGHFYWLCPACVNPKMHPEQQLIRWARTHHIDLSQCQLYLWGHYACCPSCTQKVLSTELKEVFICEGCEDFRK